MGQLKNNTKPTKWKHLSEKERYKIEILSQQGLKAAEIGRILSPNRDRRTIERELKRGTVEQRGYEWQEKKIYLADVGQRVYEENSSNKGRPLKIGHDHALAKHIEGKIKNEKWSPDVVLKQIFC